MFSYFMVLVNFACLWSFLRGLLARGRGLKNVVVANLVEIGCKHGVGCDGMEWDRMG
jgi:hypothetical protein